MPTRTAPKLRATSSKRFETVVRSGVDLRGVASVKVVDLGDLQQTGAGHLSLAEVVAGQPGVNLQSAGGLGQFSTVFIRGSAAQQVAVFIDGIPLNHGGQSAVDLSQFSLEGIDHVEIHNLPPLELGSSALGGVINLISRRGLGPPSLQMSTGSGSFGTRKASINYSESHGDLRVAASLTYQGTSGNFPYYATSGFVYNPDQQGEVLRQNNGSDQIAAMLNLSFRLGSWNGQLQAQGLLKWQQVPGPGQPGSQSGAPSLDWGTTQISAWLGRPLWHDRLTIRARIHAIFQRGLYKNIPFDLSEFLAPQLGGQALLSMNFLSRHQLTLLNEAQYEAFLSSDLCPAPRLDCSRSDATRSDRTRMALALGGKLRGVEDTWLIQPELHVQFTQSRLFPVSGSTLDPSALFDSSGWFLSPRLGGRLRLLPWLLLRANAGRFMRLPTFLELFGDQAFYRSNIALNPETAWTAEAGLRVEWTQPWLRLEGEFTGYYREVSDLISILRDGPTLRARNIGGARMGGLELALHVAVKEYLLLRFAYTWLDARDLTEVPGRRNNLLPGRPEHSLFMRVDAGRAPWRLFYELDYVSLLFLDPANLQPRPARLLHHLGIRIGPYDPARISMAVELRNLADTRIVSVPLSLTSDGRPAYTPLVDFFDYPLPGRSIHASISAKF